MGLKRRLRDNGLSIVVFALFGIFLLGQSIAGHRNENEERRDHGLSELAYGDYLLSGEFFEATFENWESEFLAVGALVVLSIYLREKKSAQSREVESPHGRTEA